HPAEAGQSVGSFRVRSSRKEQGAARLRSCAGLLHSHLTTAHAGTLVDRDSKQQDHGVSAVAFQYGTAIGAGTVPASRTEKQGQHHSRESSSGVVHAPPPLRVDYYLQYEPCRRALPSALSVSD